MQDEETANPRPLDRHRSAAVKRKKRGSLGLAKLLLAAIGLLLIAYLVGETTRSAPDPDSARASAKTDKAEVPSPAIASPPRPRVIRGKKSTTLVEVGEARMSLSADGLSVRIEGGVGRRFVDDLQRILQNNPSLQRIDISSGGGYSTSGLEAARLIRKRNLIVKVHGYCASICVALWAAAPQRQMQANAVIGLHQWNPQCHALPSPEREQCSYQAQFATDHASSYDAWLRSAGFNQYLLDLQKDTAAENIALLSALQLWDNGVDFTVTAADGTVMNRADVERVLATGHPHDRRR